MSRYRRVVWSEGMLLSPQHLQQWDRALQHEVDSRFQAVQPNGHGFTQLVIDRDALRNGRFAIVSARGVFPDGAPFAMPDDEPVPVPRAIDEHFGTRRESLIVMLGLPSARPGRAQLGEAPRPGSPGARYAAETLEIADDNDAAGARPITVARRNLCLMVPEDALDEHDLLPVAEVRRSTEGAYVLREDFVPPCLSIGASDFLMSRLQSALEMLITKSDELSAKRRVRGGVADFSVSDLTTFGQLHTVNASIPDLRHWVHQRSAHPVEVYRGLAALAGALCTFSPDHAAKQVPVYDHGAPGAAFKELHAWLLDLLRKGPDTRAVRVELERQEDSIYVGRIEDPRLLESSAMLYLGASANLEKDRLLRDLPVKIKIASRSQINRIVELALEGVEVSFTQDPPASLPLRPNYFYFKLNPVGDAWDGIRGAKNVAIFAPTDMPGLDLDLVGLRDS